MNDQAVATAEAAQGVAPIGTRILHTMLRVFDLEKSIAFYTQGLGMKLLRRTEFPSGRFTLAFVGYGSEEDNAVIELTHNWDQAEPYDKGNAYGHIAIAVQDAYRACEIVAERGGRVTRPAGPMKHGGKVIAFIEDPDGYKIEFVERD